MAGNATRPLLSLARPLPVRGASAPVERSFIQRSIDLWEEALAAEVPVPEAAPRVHLLRLDEVLTAPLVASSPAAPVLVTREDGLLADAPTAIADRLAEEGKRLLLAEAGTRLPGAPETTPARATYVFAQPVTEVSGHKGTLYTKDPGDRLVPYVQGMPATVIVEEAPLVTAEEAVYAARGTYQNGVITWTLSE